MSDLDKDIETLKRMKNIHISGKFNGSFLNIPLPQEYVDAIENVLLKLKEYKNKLEKQDSLIELLRNNLKREMLTTNAMSHYIEYYTDIYSRELKEQCIKCREKDEDYEGVKWCTYCIGEYFRKRVENE